MTLFLELLAAGLLIAIVVLLPISYGMSKLLVRDPPDLARLFGRRAPPSIRLPNTETRVEGSAFTVVQTQVITRRGPVLSTPSYVALATLVQTERRLGM